MISTYRGANFTTLSFFLSIFIVSCFGSGKVSKDKKSSEVSAIAAATVNPKTPAEILAGLQAEEQNLTAKKPQIQNLYFQLSAVNSALCTRYFRYRKECVANMRLLASEDNNRFGCTGDDLQEKLKNNFTVSLNASAGAPFQLVADGGGYESNEFSAGSNVAINWTSKDSSDLSPPKISELNTLKLYSNSDVAFSVTGFNLNINGINVLNNLNFLENRANTSHQLDLGGLVKQKKSAVCKVPQEEIDQIAAAVSQVTATATPTATATSLQLEDATASPSATSNEEDQIQAKINELQPKVEALKAEVAKLQQDLDWEQTRNGHLKNELLGDAATGCWSKQTVKSLEINIEGSHLGETLANPESKDPKNSDNLAASITFEFGYNFVYDNPNEESQAIFTQNGKAIINEKYKFRRVSEIEYIKIKKGGMGIKSVAFQKYNWMGGSSTRYKISEINRYALNSLTLKVNGKVLYSKDGINHVFSGDPTLSSWSDMSIRSNQAYMTLMNSNDCSQ